MSWAVNQRFDCAYETLYAVYSSLLIFLSVEEFASLEHKSITFSIFFHNNAVQTVRLNGIF